MDGAKRDRLVWPGDLIISAPSMFVSTNNLDGVKNGIDSLFLLQQPDGRLPWAGVPFTSPGNFPFSFTYHLYTLLDVHRYHLYTGDLDYLRRYWDQYKLALSWSVATIDGSGLANVASTNDWLRSGMGGHNVEVSALGIVPIYDDIARLTLPTYRPMPFYIILWTLLCSSQKPWVTIVKTVPGDQQWQESRPP
jgi:hypothetical protein